MPRHCVKIPKACKQCGSIRLVSESAIADGRGSFCSKACQTTFQQTPLGERFWDYVEKTDGCWLWNGTRTSAGYGQVRFIPGPRNPFEVAHRIAWKLTHGEIPDGLYVCHRCDNPPCVRPDHLFLGTPRDNAMDCINKRRHRPARGEAKVSQVKFRNEDVVDIRARYQAGGVTMQDLADEFSVSLTTIFNVIQRKRWAHIK